ncbi:hypothetical protein [Leuconostoc lactis]|uniref:hypothetical protein n=1 Tax=Leuconostoc lactis TaxID=1246 RepID=UPI0031DB34A9
MSRLFPRGIRVRYWHSHLRRSLFCFVGITMPGFVIIFDFIFSVVALIPRNIAIFEIVPYLIYKINWTNFFNEFLVDFFVVAGFSAVVTGSLALWYFKTYKSHGIWATAWRLQRLANWLIANNYYRTDDQSSNSRGFSDNSGGWHW